MHDYTCIHWQLIIQASKQASIRIDQSSGGRGAYDIPWRRSSRLTRLSKEWRGKNEWRPERYSITTIVKSMGRLHSLWYLTPDTCWQHGSTPRMRNARNARNVPPRGLPGIIIVTLIRTDPFVTFSFSFLHLLLIIIFTFLHFTEATLQFSSFWWKHYFLHFTLSSKQYLWFPLGQFRSINIFHFCILITYQFQYKMYWNRFSFNEE